MEKLVSIEFIGIIFVAILGISLMLWALWPNIQKHRKRGSLIIELWVHVCGGDKVDNVQWCHSKNVNSKNLMTPSSYFGFFIRRIHLMVKSYM